MAVAKAKSKTKLIMHVHTRQVKEMKNKHADEFLKSDSWIECDAKGNPVKQSTPTK